MKSLASFDIVVALKIGLNEKRLRESHKKSIANNDLGELSKMRLEGNSVGDLSDSL